MPRTRTGRVEQVAAVLVREGLGVPLARMRVTHCHRWSCRVRCTWRRWTGRQPTGNEWPLAVRNSLITLGPAFVKVGQLLSVRSDLVPEELGTALRDLQGNVPPVAFAVVREQAERCLGQPFAEAFRDFEETPLAAGSIAQVHVAWLPDGRKVAVKIKRPGIQELLEEDLDILVWLARRLEATFAKARQVGAVAAAEELRRYTLLELDLRNEGKTTAEVRAGLSKIEGVIVPEMHHIGPDILVMDFVDCFAMDDSDRLEAFGVDRALVVRRGLEAVLTQMFELGLFHGDPHPGNLRVTPDGQVVLLDFGIFGRFDERLQRDGTLLVWALARGDAELASFFLMRMAEIDAGADVAGFRRAVEARYREWHGKGVTEYGFGRLVYEEITLGARYGMRFPPDLILFAKAMLTMEGVVGAVLPSFDLATEALPYMEQVRRKLFSPDRLREGLLQALPLWWDLAERLPLGLAEWTEHRVWPGSPQRWSRPVTAQAMLSASALIAGALMLVAGVPPAPAGVSVVGLVVFVLAVVAGLVTVRTERSGLQE